MRSKVLGGDEVAKASVSQQQLQNSKTKGRHQYDLPKNPSQLNDRAARRSEETMMNQFYQSSQSITPHPDASNWVPRNNLLMTMDGTTMADRISGTRKDRNVITFGSVAPTTIRVSAGYGGEDQSRVMFKKVIDSGALDVEIAEYQRKSSLRSMAEPNCNVEFVNSKSDHIAARSSAQNKRKFTGRQRTQDDIAQDATIGSTRIVSQSWADLERSLV